MNFNWNSKQEALKAQFAAFGREVVAPRAGVHAAQGQFDLESWKALADAGFWDLLMGNDPDGDEPVGLQERWWNFTAAAEGLASEAADGGFVLSLIGQAGIIRALQVHGTEEQCAKFLPRLLKGSLAATCIAERHGGTDLSGIQTELRGSDGKWRLRGEKWNISHAPDAEILLVAARILEGGRSRLCTLLLDADLQGLERGEPDEKMGNRSLPTGSLRFEGVKVSAEHFLGVEGRSTALQSAAALQRIYYGLLGTQLPQPIFRHAETFLRDRQSMGQSLAKHQYVQGRLTQAILLREQATWTSRAALGKLLDNQPEAMLLSSVSKITGSDAAIQIARELTTLLGSEGYLEGQSSRILRDLLAWVAVGGTEEAHRINIFQQLNRLKKQSIE